MSCIEWRKVGWKNRERIYEKTFAVDFSPLYFGSNDTIFFLFPELVIEWIWGFTVFQAKTFGK